MQSPEIQPRAPIVALECWRQWPQLGSALARLDAKGGGPPRLETTDPIDL